jgi:hypothetical protein
MNVKKTAIYTALASALVFGGSAQAAEVIVDLFVDPALGHDVSTAIIGTFDTDQAGAYPATIIGGYRDLSITKLTDDFGVATQGDAAMAAGGGALTLDNATGVTSRGVITWDGANFAGNDGASVDTTGLGGYDLTMGGVVDTFLADVIYADLGFFYEIKVWDMDGSMATLAAGVQVSVGPNGMIPSETAHYNFDWFQLPTGQYCDGVIAPPLCADPFTQLDFSITRGGNMGDIDFTNIGALQIVLYNTAEYASADFALGNIRAVPEPSTLALLGLGLLGLGFSARRKLVG